MIVDPQDIRLIEARFKETIEDVRLLTETKPSRLFHLCGNRHYVLKQTKRVPLQRQFNNHKTVYDQWLTRRDRLEFRIPEPLLLGPDGRFILMEYIEGANLLTRLVTEEPGFEALFSQVGRGLRQYHDLMTGAMKEGVQDLREYEYMADLLRQPGGSVIDDCLDDFPPNTQTVLFKDFTSANVVVSEAGHIYFLDIQEAFYTGPFYYDLARFIDTAMVFSIVRKPSRMLPAMSPMRRAVQAFLTGYGTEVDCAWLKRMQGIHRKEHVYIKKTVTPLHALVLKILYTVLK